jgi:hypothetical protein
MWIRHDTLECSGDVFDPIEPQRKSGDVEQTRHFASVRSRELFKAPCAQLQGRPLDSALHDRVVSNLGPLAEDLQVVIVERAGRQVPRFVTGGLTSAKFDHGPVFYTLPVHVRAAMLGMYARVTCGTHAGQMQCNRWWWGGRRAMLPLRL